MLHPFGPSGTPGLPGLAVLAASAAPCVPDSSKPATAKLVVRQLEAHGTDGDVMTRQAA